MKRCDAGLKAGQDGAELLGIASGRNDTLRGQIKVVRRHSHVAHTATKILMLSSI